MTTGNSPKTTFRVISSIAVGSIISFAMFGIATERLPKFQSVTHDAAIANQYADISLIHHPIKHAESTVKRQDQFDTVTRPFLATFCLRCHQGDDAEAGVDLTEFDSQLAVNADLESWEEIMEAIDDQYMPPSDEPQPSSTQTAELKKWYLKTVNSIGKPAGVQPMRRLNQIEYQNTVQDLLMFDGQLFTNASQVLLTDDYFRPETRKMPRYVLAMSHFSWSQKRPPFLSGMPEVPSDPPVEHGFSNDHTSLSFSPLQTERYFELANSILNAPLFPRLSRIWTSLFLPSELDETVDQHVATASLRLETFLQRAFRRPITKLESDRFTELFRKDFESHKSFVQAMRTTVSAVLVSPSFLFRRDFSAASFDGERTDSYALASRLSYFLWASMPDDKLFQAARQGKLSSQEGLIAETRRMLQDKRIKSLATDFGMQWLKVASVASVRPDRDLFREFYQSKDHTPAASMSIEQLLLFETIMVEDRNIVEFINADFGYVNRTLLDWYQINPQEALGYTPPKDSFEDFYRINWTNKHKGGVLTSGATLISTSATTRTSPVYRGAWILDVMFNRPPPAPPADVPALEESGKHSNKPLNVRERLAIHRNDQNCSVCHNRIDPLGFALEKFDAVGRFRKSYENEKPIDAKGELFGEQYDGAARFKAVMARNKQEFIQGFTEHMLKYALGRQLEFSDEECIGNVVERVTNRGHHFSAVVEEIVLSDVFRMPPKSAVNSSEPPKSRN